MGNKLENTSIKLDDEGWSAHFASYVCPIRNKRVKVCVEIYNDDIVSGATVKSEIEACYDTYFTLRDEEPEYFKEESVTIEMILSENGIYDISFEEITITK